ncbi:MAG TPA: hypothetical protein VM266_04960 [Solirubrobacteraceae bacterium]|nr:hypothetical protein [Solirubrobacteraceae bacterium]
MSRPQLAAHVVATLCFALGLLIVALAVTGNGPDWLMRCGGRFLKHDCAPGEIPWRWAFAGVLMVVSGLVLSTGEIYVRRGRVWLGGGLLRRQD